MRTRDIKPNMRVLIKNRLHANEVFGGTIDDSVLQNRQNGAGRYAYVQVEVPGFSNEVWWVKQVTGRTVYCFDEFDPV